MTDPFETCPCGTGTAYAGCCAPLHAGRAAASAEALMRARYSAFVRRDGDYLFRTWHPRTRPDDLSLPAVTWTGLEVLATSDGGENDATGTVEFVARSRDASGDHALHETSRFARRAGRWVYLDGDVERGVRLRE